MGVLTNWLATWFNSAATEEDAFIQMIQVVMEDKVMREALVSILQLERDYRTAALDRLIGQMEIDRVPAVFLSALVRLKEDEMAARALTAIA